MSTFSNYIHIAIAVHILARNRTPLKVQNTM